MVEQAKPDELQYFIQFVTTGTPPERVRGFHRVPVQDTGDALHTSEWLLAGGAIPDIIAAFAGCGEKSKRLRLHKPYNDHWCTVDVALFQEAIARGFTIQV